MSRGAHLEDQRLVASADTNLVAPDLQRHPLIADSIALPRRIELLDEKILHVGSGIRQSPTDPRVVANDDEGNAGDRDTGNVQRA